MNIPTRRQAMARARQNGLKIAAVLPIHYPRALLRAHGFHPVEVWGPPGYEPHQGGGHFPEYTCAIARNAATLLAGPEGKEVDLILVPHTCDSLQGMASILQGYLDTGRPALHLYNPRETTVTAELFLAEELKRLGAELSRCSGRRPEGDELHQAIDIEEQADDLFNHMCLNRRAYALSDPDFYQALRSREYLSAEDFLELDLPAGPPRDGLPIMLSGIAPEPMDLLERLDGLGALVVGDDLACCGRRVYQAEYHPNPYRRLARRLLSKPADPTAGHSVAQRIAHVSNRMEQTGARGMIVLNVKFCEPELFFLPLQKKALEERGWPTLYIEDSLPARAPHQTITRVEAFLEVLQ